MYILNIVELQLNAPKQYSYGHTPIWKRVENSDKIQIFGISTIRVFYHA